MHLMNFSCAAVAALSLCAACGPKPVVPVPPCDAETGTSLSVEPQAVIAGESAALVARFVNGSRGAIAPGLGPVASGVAQTVLPTSTTSYLLTVTSGACTATRTAVLTVAQSAQLEVSITPASATLDQGAPQDFQASVSNFPAELVSWSVVETGGGTIDELGRYTAPKAAGTFHVMAAARAAPTRTQQAAVTVRELGLSVSPASPIVARGGTQLFTATVTGSIDTAVSWKVLESGCGAIDSTGAFVASEAVGTCHVVAASHGDPSKSASATVSVVAVNVAVAPLSVTVHAGLSHTFTADVLGIADHSIDWSVAEPNGGSIAADGTFTASILAGTVHVVAASHAVPTATATATVTVPDGLPAVPPLVNVVAEVHGDTVRVAFDPVDGAADYRIYPAPSASEIVNEADGGVAIRNAIYRCAGDREAPPVPTDDEPQGQGNAVITYVDHDVHSFVRTTADAILGYVYVSPGPGRSPVWALGDGANDGDNACYSQRWTESRAKQYATSQAEHAALLAQGFRDDGIAFYVPGAGDATSMVYTAVQPDRYSSPFGRFYFVSATELEARAQWTPTAAFSVAASPGPGLGPLFRVFYDDACGKSHDELVVGEARFRRAVHQGLTPIPLVNWAGLAGPRTMVVEALDRGCPFQGHLSPGPVAGGAHQAFMTLDQLRSADPMGEVFVGGEHESSNRPSAIARAVLQVSPASLEPMDFADDFAPDGGTILPMQAMATPNFRGARFDSPAYDVEFYYIDLPYLAVGPMLGELWVTYADWASDTNGKFRLTIKKKAALASQSFLHVTAEVDLVTTDRRYPQLLVSSLDPPVQENLPNGVTFLMQTFGMWPPRVDLQLCDHRTWDVNNQCPRFYVDKESQSPFSSDPLPPHSEIGDLAGVDRRVRLDLYLSTMRAYALVENQPWACVDLPSPGSVNDGGIGFGGVPGGPVSVTFGDVLYHSGVDVPDPPYSFHRAHLYTETERHLDAFGYKNGVAAPPWDESVLPCSSALQP